MLNLDDRHYLIHRKLKNCKQRRRYQRWRKGMNLGLVPSFRKNDTSCCTGYAEVWAWITELNECCSFIKPTKEY